MNAANIQNFAANPDRVLHWQGLRQDSGDPFAFAPRVQQLYQSLGIDHQGKAIIYSDGLNVTKCLELQRQCEMLGLKGKSSVMWNKDA
jgi:nicotinate phosphoribosyltransferase